MSDTETSERELRRNCKIDRIRADLLEEAVEKALPELLMRGSYFENLGDRLKINSDKESESLKDQKRHFTKLLSEIELKIEQAFDLTVSITAGDAATIIRDRLEKLSQEKKKFSAMLEETIQKLDKVGTRDTALDAESQKKLVRQFKAGWKKASSLQKRRFIGYIIEKIFVTEDGPKVHYYALDEQFSKN